jgi:protein-tyrosine-phosphatase
MTATRTPKTKILFVCAGNTCRSPMAEMIFKTICKRHHRTGVMVRSAGTAAEVGADMMPEAMIALQDAGITIAKKPHRAQQYLPKMQHQYDYIFDLRDYADPYGNGQAAYDAVCAKLFVDLEALYQQIFDLKNPHPVLC